jgi:hypothetical protein
VVVFTILIKVSLDGCALTRSEFFDSWGVRWKQAEIARQTLSRVVKKVIIGGGDQTGESSAVPQPGFDQTKLTDGPYYWTDVRSLES